MKPVQCCLKHMAQTLLEKSSVFERHKRLKDGWLYVECIEGSGRKKRHKKKIR